MERIEKIALDELNYDPDFVARRLYEFGKIAQSVHQAQLIHENKDTLLGRLVHWMLKMRRIDIPDEPDTLFGLVEVMKSMRFWLWAIEKTIEIHGKDAPPELFEFIAADRGEYDNLTNSEKKE